MKKIIAMVLVALLVLSMAACGSSGDSGNDLAVAQAELNLVKEELNTAKSDLNAKTAELEALQAKLAELENEAGVKAVFALHATIDGQTTVPITGQTELTAQAVLAEGQVVDHWELNGEVQPDATGETFTFTASENTIVEAVLRAEKKITTVNCTIRFLNKNGEASGDKYEEFVFEKPYKNPVTDEEITDGKITVQIRAEVPSGYMVDYWLINGVKYDYSNSVNGFVVEGLDEATEYEVVLKEIYYKVTCYGCTVNGKTELWVRPGTKLTAVADGGYYSVFWINDVQMNDRWDDPYVKQWTFTVNGDTHVDAYAIIN